MTRDKIPSARLWAWIVTAAAAPLASIYTGQWLPVLIYGVASAALSWLVQRVYQETKQTNLFVGILQWSWIGILLGNLAKYSAGCWVGDHANPIVPLVLLVLAAFLAGGGAVRASRAGATLFWVVVITLALVLGAGVEHWKTQYLLPRWEMPDNLLIPILLLPCTAVFLPREDKKCSLLISISVATLAVVISFCINGSLSAAVASEKGNPFYAYSKSINLFGIAQRFESLVSSVVTACWFSLFGLLLGAAGHQARAIGKEMARPGVWCCAAVATVILLCELHIPSEWLAVGTLIFWVAIPLLAQGIGSIKKS